MFSSKMIIVLLYVAHNNTPTLHAHTTGTVALKVLVVLKP